MNDYTTLPGFADVVLEESWVLAVRALPAEVRFDLEVVLTKGHPEYTSPKDGEVESYRRGSLRFVGVTRLLWEEQGLPPAIDAADAEDYGHIDSMRHADGVFHLDGDWGRMSVTAERAEIVLGGG